MRFAEVAEVGKIRSRRTRQGKVRWYADLRPYGRIFSVPGFGALETEADAARVLGHIQGELSRGATIEEILARYLPTHAKPYLVETKVAAWLDVQRDEAEAGDRSPTYVRELERYARPEGHFSWWYGKSIFEINAASVDDWNLWLRQRGIGSKTRWNVVGAFRSMLGSLRRRGELRDIPEVARPSVDEYSPTVISVAMQDGILEAIPESERGIFLAMARLA
jgi:hypothetical protein